MGNCDRCLESIICSVKQLIPDARCHGPRTGLQQERTFLAFQFRASLLIFFFLNIRKKMHEGTEEKFEGYESLNYNSQQPCSTIQCYKPFAGLRFLNALSYFQKASIILLGGGGYNPQVFSNLPTITSGKTWDSNLWVSIYPQIPTFYLNQQTDSSNKEES